MTAVTDWSRLPKDLLEQIVRKTTLLRDNLSFGAVCSSWRSVAINNRNHLSKQLPGLLLPGNGGDSTENRPLFEVGAPLVYLPVPHRYYCCGSNFGWLVLVDDDFSMQLFNPVSRQTFQLPSSTTLPQPIPMARPFKYYVLKAFISCPPTNSTPDKTLVLVICGMVGRILAFCRLGDQVWTPIKSIGRRHYVDAIYYNHKFYAMYTPGGVVTCEINNSFPRVIHYARHPGCEIYHMTRYLVQSQGYLFHLRRNIKYDLDKDASDDKNSDNDSDDGYYDWVNNYSGDDVDQQGDDNVDQQGDGSDNENINHESDQDGGVETEENDSEADQENGNQDGGSDEHGATEIEDKISGKDETEENDSEAGQENGNQDGGSDEHVGAETEVSDKDESDHGGHCKSDSEVKDERETAELIRRYRTLGFKVFKLKMKDGCCACQRKWEKVENIGDSAFFVGYNTSFSLTASDVLGCKPNSIYFTDSEISVPGRLDPIRHDIGVFNLEDRTVEEVYPINSEPTRPPAFWFTPALSDPTPP